MAHTIFILGTDAQQNKELQEFIRERVGNGEKGTAAAHRGGLNANRACEAIRYGPYSPQSSGKRALDAHIPHAETLGENTASDATVLPLRDEARRIAPTLPSYRNWARASRS